MLRRIAPLLCLPVLLGSCEDEVNTLFDEEGVWALVEFDNSGDGLMAINDNRENSFLLRFMPTKKGEGIVAAAGCTEPDGTGEPLPADPSSGLCHLDDNAVWECSCFKYIFEDQSMTWVEYEPGSAPPATVPPAGGSGGTGGGEGGSTLITLAQREEVASTYVFQPLPTGLFNANESSVFVFQQKAESIWTNYPEGNPSMPPDCDMQCM